MIYSRCTSSDNFGIRCHNTDVAKFLFSIQFQTYLGYSSYSEIILANQMAFLQWSNTGSDLTDTREYGGQLPEGGLKPDMLIFYLIDPSTKQNNVFAINERKYLKCIGSGRMRWERAGPRLVHVGSMHLGINMMVLGSCLRLQSSKITPYKYRSCPFTETTASTVITNILSLSSYVVCYFSWLYNRSGYWLCVPRSYLLHMRKKTWRN